MAMRKYQAQGEGNNWGHKSRKKPRPTVYCAGCGRKKVVSKPSFFRYLCPMCLAVKEENKRRGNK